MCTTAAGKTEQRINGTTVIAIRLQQLCSIVTNRDYIDKVVERQ